MVIPFGKFGLRGTPGVSSVDTTSCMKKNGPGGVPEMPGGNMVCARKPTVRVEKARSLLEKKTAVRAFCTARSQLNTVASGVRKVPSTVGPTPSAVGLLTTQIQTRAGVIPGGRIPAR